MTAVQGGTETTVGNDKLHTFTADGSFTVTEAGLVWLLIVGGGGGGGSNGGGGGGAGTAKEYPILYLPVGSYTVQVGVGGAGRPDNAGDLTCIGETTYIDSTGLSLHAPGGGGGASRTAAPMQGTSTGGSGGGGGGADTSYPQQKGLALQWLGNFGGAGIGTGTSSAGGGGGGAAVGASGVGANAASQAGGNGGAGLASTITGSSVTYAGGGGGGVTVNGTRGLGGSGGGGNGYDSTHAVTAGTANTGGGGGGGGAGAAGGSGVIMIRYKRTFNYLHARRDRLNTHGISTQNNRT